MPSLLRRLLSITRSGRNALPLGIAAAALALVAPSCPGTQAQGPTLTPVMLKRIAEALDGNRTGEKVYVVISTQGTNEVLGVTPDKKTADELVRASRGTAIDAGQFLTVADSAHTVAACVHDGYNSRLHIDKCVGPLQRLTFDDISAMSLLITRTGGGVDTLPIPLGSDAIFLSMPAIDKFVIPYYLRTVGIAASGDMRGQLQQVYGGGRGANTPQVPKP